jgi:putative endonuclease
VTKSPAVYILASKHNGTLYVGVTSNLPKRVWEHKNGAFGGFTKRYNIHRLVYFEAHDTMESAILREKHLKRFGRSEKMALIQTLNPNWRDLYSTIH